MQGTRQGDLYILQGSTVTGNSSFVSQSKASDNSLWHMRLGHMSERGIEILCKKGLLGNLKMETLQFCEDCVYGKQHRLKFPKGVHTTKATLDLVHADCWGPSKVPSLGGARYFLSVIDDYSRKTWVFMMKQKFEAFQNFKHWTVLMRNQTGKRVKRLRTDNGLEFCSEEFNNLCKEEGIARQHIFRHTPQQNGVAERMNRTLLERARCMLSNARLDANFWAEAVNTACYMVNLSLSTVNGFKTPVEVWSDQPDDYAILKVFGCPAYYHVMEGKLEPRAKKGIFVGYGRGVKGFRIWSPSKGKVILSRDVTFNEKSLLRPQTAAESKEDKKKSQEVTQQVEVETTTSRLQEQPQPDGSGGDRRYPQECVQQQFHEESGAGSSQTAP